MIQPRSLLLKRLGQAVLVSCLVWFLFSGCMRHIATPALPVVSAQTRPPEASSIHFEDVADQAGLRYRWTIPGKRPLNILQTIGNGCAFLDYNNDGNLDILLVGPKLALYRGDGKGHFTDVTKETGLDKLHGHSSAAPLVITTTTVMTISTSALIGAVCCCTMIEGEDSRMSPGRPVFHPSPGAVPVLLWISITMAGWTCSSEIMPFSVPRYSLSSAISAAYSGLRPTVLQADTRRVISQSRPRKIYRCKPRLGAESHLRKSAWRGLRRL